MKICHVSFAPTHLNDADEWLKSGAYYTKVLEALRTYAEVHSVHYINSPAGKEMSVNGVHYHFLPFSVTEKLTAHGLVQLANDLNPDALVLHGFHAVWTSLNFVRSVRVDSIYCQHHGEKLFRWPKSFLHKITDRYLKGYFFSSGQLAHEWIEKKLIEDQTKVHEVMEVSSSFTGTDPRHFRQNPLSFLWVGRLNENKDPLTLIDAFIEFLKFNPHATLDLIHNDGPMLDGLQKRAIGSGNQIRFIGSVPHSEMVNRFYNNNFIVSTSLSEGSGVAVLEGMSCGCVPILTKIPSFETMTNSGAVGILFEKQSATALCGALIAAVKIDLIEERERVIDHFDKVLSPAAIAEKIFGVLSQAK